MHTRLRARGDANSYVEGLEVPGRGFLCRIRRAFDQLRVKWSLLRYAPGSNRLASSTFGVCRPADPDLQSIVRRQIFLLAWKSTRCAVSRCLWKFSVVAGVISDGGLLAILQLFGPLERGRVQGITQVIGPARCVAPRVPAVN